MAEATATYDLSISGFWNSRHTFRLRPLGEVTGVLTIRRNRWGLVAGGRYEPSKGDLLVIRRDPGLLRSQFSLWTEGREWLGSSLRWHVARREIVLHTGSRPLRVLPVAGLRCGWSLVAPKTGEMAVIRGAPLARRARIEVFRKLDFELVVFSYFLGSQLWSESLWPGPTTREAPSELPAPGKSPRPVDS